MPFGDIHKKGNIVHKGKHSAAKKKKKRRFHLYQQQLPFQYMDMVKNFLKDESSMSVGMTFKS